MVSYPRNADGFMDAEEMMDPLVGHLLM